MKPEAGQLVRFIDIPVETNTGYKALNYIPDRFETAKEVIKYLNRAVKDNYGTPSRAFIRFIAEKINNQDDYYFEYLTKRINDLVDIWQDGKEIGEQRERILSAFAQVAIAGEEATEQGFTGWEVGDATKAAKDCLDRATELRGKSTEIGANPKLWMIFKVSVYRTSIIELSFSINKTWFNFYIITIKREENIAIIRKLFSCPRIIKSNIKGFCHFQSCNIFSTNKCHFNCYLGARPSNFMFVCVSCFRGRKLIIINNL